MVVGVFFEFLLCKDVFVVFVFVVLFKFIDVFFGMMMVLFVIDFGFICNDYVVIVKGVGLVVMLIGGFVGGFVVWCYLLVVLFWIGGVV